MAVNDRPRIEYFVCTPSGVSETSNTLSVNVSVLARWSHAIQGFSLTLRKTVSTSECCLLISAQRLKQSEVDWQIELSGPEYHTLQLDTRLPHKQTTDSLD